jgi:hypothetical protein
MIVNHIPEGWEIIHQRAHGILAVQIASHWKATSRPVRWVETLMAIAEHDDAQEDWQGRNHLNENGTPMHFDQKPFSFTQMKRIAEVSQHKSRWIALLISKHLSFLYEPLQEDYKELGPFLDAQKAQQAQWTNDLGVKPAEVQYAYDLLQWCDQFSLILCQNELPTGERALEISKGPDGKVYQVRQLSDGTVTVHPWPFEEPEFTVSVETTIVQELQFKNDEELLSAIKASEVRPKVWQLVKG